MKKIIFGLFISAVFANCVYAANKTGEIDGYAVYETLGTKYFYFTIKNYYAPGEDPGTCNTTSRFVFNDSKGIYELFASAIMSAHHSGSSINLNYEKTCTVAASIL